MKNKLSKQTLIDIFDYIVLVFVIKGERWKN